MRCSVGIMAYNEEKNIGRLLEAIAAQRTNMARIDEIYVVSSACTDRTDEIVGEHSKKDPRIKLIKQEERKGKSSAICLWLRNVAAGIDVCIMESADTLPEPDTFEKLVLPFQDKNTGMTGAKVVPVNDSGTFMGFAVNLLWDLHHKLALIRPKLGELTAFRNIIREIPEESAVDEASMEAQICREGYTLKYVPDATVRNKGAENVRDFLKQRRRIAAGHMWLKDSSGYEVSTASVTGILRVLFSYEGLKGVKPYFYLAGTVLLEAWGRALGWFDYRIRNRNPYRWQIASSTKGMK